MALGDKYVGENALTPQSAKQFVLTFFKNRFNENGPGRVRMTQPEMRVKTKMPKKYLEKRIDVESIQYKK